MGVRTRRTNGGQRRWFRCSAEWRCLLRLESTATRSFQPSPFKSPATSAVGTSPTGRVPARVRCVVRVAKVEIDVAEAADGGNVDQAVPVEVARRPLPSPANVVRCRRRTRIGRPPRLRRTSTSFEFWAATMRSGRPSPVQSPAVSPIALAPASKTGSGVCPASNGMISATTTRVIRRLTHKAKANADDPAEHNRGTGCFLGLLSRADEFGERSPAQDSVEMRRHAAGNSKRHAHLSS